MEIYSRTQYNATPNQQSVNTITVVLVLTGPWCSPWNILHDSDPKENLNSSEKSTQVHCSGVRFTCSLHHSKQSRQCSVMSGTHLTGQMAYGPYFPCSSAIFFLRFSNILDLWTWVYSFKLKVTV
ncbi:hypothetical protein AVEN_72885-1 [Araneus ventricosus]|uniref:Uncharacterized protein n=1 Tax=Araneus ventricosus TaxID=182803 RepID=A0A4Y2U7R3_ARAVE|nr:hypothetical protein AVEN_72885-1 [Araneus ventricosus]